MIKLRKAEESDWARLLAWRNDPEARKQSKQIDPLKVDEHLTWVKGVLQNKDVQLFVAHDTERSRCVGTCRLDLIRRGKDAEWGEVSLTIDPQYRGQGYAGQILAALRELGAVWPPSGLICGLQATVKADNLPSLRAFVEAGYQLYRLDKQICHLELPL